LSLSLSDSAACVAAEAWMRCWYQPNAAVVGQPEPVQCTAKSWVKVAVSVPALVGPRGAGHSATAGAGGAGAGGGGIGGQGGAFEVRQVVMIGLGCQPLAVDGDSQQSPFLTSRIEKLHVAFFLQSAQHVSSVVLYTV
jgi:hypothetical protein